LAGDVCEIPLRFVEEDASDIADHLAILIDHCESAAGRSWRSRWAL
jgi:hypothetical protein